MAKIISTDNRILIPINFSKASQNLFDYGLELCNALNKSMMLLYIVDLTEFSSLQDYYRNSDKLNEEISNKLEKLYLKKAKIKYPNVSIHIAIKGGYTLDKVLKTTNLKKIDQILIATGAKTGLKAILYENIGTIIKNADCSIFLVPENVPFHPFRHFLYLTDYKKADLVKLKRLVKLAKYYNSKITMLHINTETKMKDLVFHKQFKDLVESMFHYEKMDFSLLSDRNIINKIFSYAETVNADTIVILKKEKSFLKNLFEKSVTNELILRIKLPTLIYHEKIK